MNKNTKILLITSILIFILAIVVFAFLTLSTKNSSKQNSNLNNTTPEETKEFIFTDSEGNELKINENTELGIAIILWNSDSENSLETLELIDKYYNTYKDLIDFYIINTNEKNNGIIEIVNNCGFTFPVYYDTNNEATNFYTINNLPTLIFITKEGEFHTINNGIDEDTLTANLDILAENY